MNDDRQRPKRIQRKRTKGWKMPPNTVYVGRPSKWGNPFIVEVMSEPGPSKYENAVLAFATWVYVAQRGPQPEQIKEELRGKNLACWCPADQPCHADVLLGIANAEN